MITSLQNPTVKRMVSLRDKTDRDRESVFIIEGPKEIRHALEGGYELETLVVCPEIIADDDARFVSKAESIKVEVSSQVYAKIAYREKVGGLMAIARLPEQSIGRFALPDNPFILVIEGVEKPGNLGALLRTADGAGVNLVIIIPNGGVDLYNPNVIRASLGAVFTLPVVVMSLCQTLAWLTDNRIRTIYTTPDAPMIYTDIDYTGPAAVILGSEARGLPKELLARDITKVSIPMLGAMDSLNVSCSAAIVMYEALRQRTRKQS